MFYILTVLVMTQILRHVPYHRDSQNVPIKFGGKSTKFLHCTQHKCSIFSFFAVGVLAVVYLLLLMVVVLLFLRRTIMPKLLGVYILWNCTALRKWTHFRFYFHSSRIQFAISLTHVHVGFVCVCVSVHECRI